MEAITLTVMSFPKLLAMMGMLCTRPGRIAVRKFLSPGQL